jgi:hypothetical protein
LIPISSISGSSRNGYSGPNPAIAALGFDECKFIDRFNLANGAVARVEIWRNIRRSGTPPPTSRRTQMELSSPSPKSQTRTPFKESGVAQLPVPDSDHKAFEMIFSKPLRHMRDPARVRWDRSPRSQRSVVMRTLVRFALGHQIGRHDHHVQ